MATKDESVDLALKWLAPQWPVWAEMDVDVLAAAFADVPADELEFAMQFLALASTEYRVTIAHVRREVAGHRLGHHEETWGDAWTGIQLAAKHLLSVEPQRAHREVRAHLVGIARQLGVKEVAKADGATRAQAERLWREQREAELRGLVRPGGLAEVPA